MKQSGVLSRAMGQLRHYELQVLPDGAEHLSPMWEGRAVLAAAARVLERTSIASARKGSRATRLASVALIPLDLWYARRLWTRSEPPLRSRILAECTEAGAWSAVLRQPGELVTALSSSTSAEIAFRFGPAGAPLAALQTAAAVGTRWLIKRRFEPGVLLSGFASVLVGGSLRRYERSRIQTVRAYSHAQLEQGTAEAYSRAKWDVTTELVRDEDTVLGSMNDLFVTLGMKFRAHKCDLSEPLNSVVNGAFAKGTLSPVGAATIRFVADHWRVTHNRDTPRLTHKVFGTVVMGDDAGDTWITPRQAAQLRRALSAEATTQPSETGVAIYLQLMQSGGYGRRVVVGLNSARLVLAADPANTFELPSAHPLPAAAVFGSVICLMDATELAGGYKVRRVIPGIASFALVAAIGDRLVMRRGEAAEFPILLGGLGASICHLVGTLPELATSPLDPLGRRRSPAHALIPWAVMLGARGSSQGRARSKALVAAGATTAALFTLIYGKPARVKDQLINWSFPIVTALAGAAYQRRSDRSEALLRELTSRHLVGSVEATYGRQVHVGFSELALAATQAAELLPSVEQDTEYLKARTAELMLIRDTALEGVRRCQAG